MFELMYGLYQLIGYTGIFVLYVITGVATLVSVPIILEGNYKSVLVTGIVGFSVIVLSQLLAIG